MEPKIKVENLHKSFDTKKVLNGVNLEVYNKESLVILGGSGSGKSVLIRSITSLLDIDSGKIFIDGQDITTLSPSKKSKIMDKFGGGTIIDKYGYGLYKCETKTGVIDIVKCLCDDMECDMCKQNTFLHITPDLDIKYCMKSSDVVKINFQNDETVEQSFEEANKRLELIK